MRSSTRANTDPASEIRKAAVLAIILASYLMIVLDISIVITALPKIRQGLGFSATELSWVQTAYTLAFGGLLLLGARAGDLFGRRRMFVVGVGPARGRGRALLAGARRSPACSRPWDRHSLDSRSPGRSHGRWRHAFLSHSLDTCPTTSPGSR
jgi:hypothetical protein